MSTGDKTVEIRKIYSLSLVPT